MEREIKVGDRVVGIGVAEGKDINGKIGTLKAVGGINVAVEFDDDINGWGSDFYGIAKGHGWGCPIANLRRITEDTPSKYAAWSVHITPNGNATHAVFKQGKRVHAHTFAVCSPRDTYDATTGAAWAFLRLPGMADTARRVLAEMGEVRPQPAPERPKRGMAFEECKVGMKVRFTNAYKHERDARYYPPVDAIGEILQNENEGSSVFVQWPKCSTSGSDRWYVMPDDIEPVTVTDEPAPVPQPMYKPGDRVRIVEKWGPGCNQAPDGSMDKWLGKVMTIRGVYKTSGSVRWYKMVEDEREYNENTKPGWDWLPAAIAGNAGEGRKDK